MTFFRLAMVFSPDTCAPSFNKKLAAKNVGLEPLRSRVPRRIPKPQQVYSLALIINRVDKPIGRAGELEQLGTVRYARFVKDRKSMWVVCNQAEKIALKCSQIFQRNGLARFTVQISKEVADVFSCLWGSPDHVRHKSGMMRAARYQLCVQVSIVFAIKIDTVKF
jgi:hypothetical protein